MNGLLVRVAADLTIEGGSWNGPADSKTGDFAYVPIPEPGKVYKGLEKPYSSMAPALTQFGQVLPGQLAGRLMHLDPDFGHLTYGDHRERAKQIREHVGPGDLIVFYAGLRDIRPARHLVYAVIGLFVVERLMDASRVPVADRDMNAHTRCILPQDTEHVIVAARPEVSGRLRRYLPIGEYRDRAYRVRNDLLKAWGGLSVKNGYLQRSARLPKFLEPERFYDWFLAQAPELVPANN